MTLAPRCACQANPPRRTLRSSWCSSVAASPCGDGVAGAAIDRIVNRRPASCLLASRSPACGRAMFLSAVRLSCGRRAASCGGSFCLSQSRPSRSVHAPGPRRTTRRQTGQNRLQVACSSNAPPKSPQKLKVAGWTGSDSELRVQEHSGMASMSMHI